MREREKEKRWRKEKNKKDGEKRIKRMEKKRRTK